ncbi:MAG: FISUMP domain-containing protein, partial [Bacteroides sp.]
MNTRFSQFIFCAFLLTFSASIFAQVTIGSSTAPESGALLQLKDDGTYSNGETASKGLGLPRVKLTYKNKLYPMFTDDGSGGYKIGTTPYTKTTEDATHIGLIVYNVNEDVCAAIPIQKGVHIWDGTQWQFLGQEEPPSADVHYYTDPRDGEIYPYRNFGTVAGDWMLENLRYNPILHPDVSGGFDGTTFTETPAHNASPYTDKYIYYSIGSTYTPSGTGAAPANWDIYKKNGILYNWAATLNIGANGVSNPGNINQGQGQPTEGPTTPIQGICPPNWHVPSDKEWNELEAAIQDSPTTYSTSTTSTAWKPAWNTATGDRGDIQGSAMKSVCPPVGSGRVNGGTSFYTAQGGFDVLL